MPRFEVRPSNIRSKKNREKGALTRKKQRKTEGMPGFEPGPSESLSHESIFQPFAYAVECQLRCV